MNYITGETIKRLRKQKNMTQQDLADILGVSDKAVSKWETGKGLPDISLIEPISKALNISVIELLSGENIINENRASNIMKSKIYVCPICGNTIHSMGETLISCCGITLPSLEVEELNQEHNLVCEKIEDELYVKIEHPMEKNHYISFIAYVNSNKFEMVKIYAEGNAEARFFIRGGGIIYYYCNKHGLYKKKIDRKGKECT